MRISKTDQATLNTLILTSSVSYYYIIIFIEHAPTM